MIERHEADRALNQLASLVVGRDLAKNTNHLEEDPRKRIYEMYRRISNEDASPTRMPTAAEIARDNRSRNTKKESMVSLLTLAEVVDELFEWYEQFQLEKVLR